jgi:hypothetical protein
VRRTIVRVAGGPVVVLAGVLTEVARGVRAAVGAAPVRPRIDNGTASRGKAAVAASIAGRTTIRWAVAAKSFEKV